MIDKYLFINKSSLIVSHDSYQKKEPGIQFVFHNLHSFSISLRRIAVIFICSFLSTGCINLVTIGDKPNITALENQLVLGKSKKHDVLQTLGKPFGKGAEMFPFRDSPRIMYTYYYEEGSMEDDRRIMLFVFLADDVYDGYMWFSSLKDKP